MWSAERLALVQRGAAGQHVGGAHSRQHGGSSRQLAQQAAGVEMSAAVTVGPGSTRCSGGGISCAGPLTNCTVPPNQLWLEQLHIVGRSPRCRGCSFKGTPLTPLHTADALVWELNPNGAERRIFLNDAAPCVSLSFSLEQNLDYNLVECQALVLAPTRELAQQIEKVRVRMRPVTM